MYDARTQCLKHTQVDLSLFTLSWFLTCFVDVLPHSVYLNIFDVFLYEGNKVRSLSLTVERKSLSQVLFRFALAVLKLGEPQVLQCKTIGEREREERESRGNQ